MSECDHKFGNLMVTQAPKGVRVSQPYRRCTVCGAVKQYRSEPDDDGRPRPLLADEERDWTWGAYGYEEGTE